MIAYGECHLLTLRHEDGGGITWKAQSYRAFEYVFEARIVAAIADLFTQRNVNRIAHG